MLTNRELYSFVAELAARHRVGQPSLEAYLRAIWGLAKDQQARAGWTLDEFAELLAAAFVRAPPDFDEAWRASPADHDPASATGFDRWQQALREQIVDLRILAESGQLSNELRYYGIDGRSGGRWFNFDPCSYLESGTVGAFGGCSPNDATELPPIEWDRFVSFLEAGRSYE